MVVGGEHIVRFRMRYAPTSAAHAKRLGLSPPSACAPPGPAYDAPVVRPKCRSLGLLAGLQGNTNGAVRQEARQVAGSAFRPAGLRHRDRVRVDAIDRLQPDHL